MSHMIPYKGNNILGKMQGGIGASPSQISPHHRNDESDYSDQDPQNASIFQEFILILHERSLKLKSTIRGLFASFPYFSISRPLLPRFLFE